MGISTANLKKVHNGRVVNEILFRAKCEDYSLEDSISDSPEKLFQRGRVKVSIYVILLKGKYGNKHIYIYFFLQKVSSSHEQLSPSECFSRYERTQELGS